MNTLDWIVTAIPLLLVLCAGIYSRRYVKSVADFMSANRSARRYLLCIAGGELQAGAVVFVAAFESFSHAGFAVGWWGRIGTPVSIIIAITGYVGYRLRETRAMTLAQFFEIRYNKSFRIFAGIMGFFAGLMNFGIIPAVGARVLVYFLGMPETVRILSITMPTYVPLMAVFLTITAFIAVSGGVITVMVINAVEGIISQLFYLIIIFTILYLFSWSQMSAVLTDPVAHPAGQSLVDPFDSFGIKDFNLWFVLMGVLISIYRTGSWQNAAGYSGAGLTPHEGRMGGILTGWREMGKAAVTPLMALAALTYLHHPAFAAGAAHVHATVEQISNSQAKEQMEAPIALAYLLPSGVKGIFCVILLMGIFGGDATHLHSWGSILVQDVLVPLRKKPFGTHLHLWVLRASIIGVACFAFLFGTFFHLVDYIGMWWGVTEAIFVGGAGSAIIGGLYWKKGTVQAAWAAFITGFVLSVGGIVLQQIFTRYGGIFQAHDSRFGFISLAHFVIEKDGHTAFRYNGTQISFVSCLTSITVYVVTSLLTCKEEFNLDRMLHRGEYAAIKPLVGDTPVVHKKKPGIGRLIGIDDNFTSGDKWIAGGTFGWNMLWFAVFIIGTIWNLVSRWSTASWLAYWHFTSISLAIFFAVVTGIWFTWGGTRDMFALFSRLREQRVNALDDGTVVDNQNLDELVVEEHAHGSHKHDNLTPKD